MKQHKKEDLFDEMESCSGARLSRLLQAIVYMSHNKVTPDQLAKRLDTSTRTVYRYLYLMQEAGVKIKMENQYKEEVKRRVFFIAKCDCPFCHGIESTSLKIAA